MDFIAQQQAAHPDLAPRYQKLKDLHVRKYVPLPASGLLNCRQPVALRTDRPDRSGGSQALP